MNMYQLEQINAQISALIDSETGEIADFEQFALLQMERDELIEALHRAYREAVMDAEKISAEIDRLEARKSKAKANADKLKDHLYKATGGEKYKSALVNIHFRTTASVDLDDRFVEWARHEFPELLRENTTYEPNKKLIAEQLKSGIAIPHASMTLKNSMIIK